MPLPLSHLISQTTPQEFSRELEALRDRLLDQYGEAVDAMLFYGSCLRSGNALDGLVDLYLVVDDYRNAYPRAAPALFNRLLPPNVYYLEVPSGEDIVRCKYAVVSLADLEWGTSSRWFHSYLWGRFCQPCGLLHSRDSQTADRVYCALSQAVLTFLNRVLPSLNEELTTDHIWTQGLALSYRAELRTEKPERALHLFESWQVYYRTLTETAIPLTAYQSRVTQGPGGPIYRLQITPATRSFNRVGWQVRRVQGKLLSVVRLMKSTFTFQGGIDYIAWKLERHTGVPIAVTPKMRRHPLVYSWGLVWRLYRRGVFR